MVLFSVVLPELGSAQLSHGFGALGSKLSGNDPEAVSDSQL